MEIKDEIDFLRQMKLRKFVASRSALKEMLKKVFLREGR